MERTSTAPCRTVVTAPPGGVLARSVGAMTGELVVETVPSARGLVVKVGYRGSPDRHHVVGSPWRGGSHPEAIRILATDPGPDDDGNPAASRLPARSKK